MTLSDKFVWSVPTSSIYIITPNFANKNKMKDKSCLMEVLRRYLFFIVGLFVNSFGICLIIKGDLGSSPISSLPYTFSMKFPISLGTLTFILNLFLIAGQIIMQKKDFNKREWLQLPVSVLFGIFIDASMFMLSWIEPHNYFQKFSLLIIGCIILGLGVSMEVIANVVMLSGEAFVRSLSQTTRKEFGIVKIFFDTSLMVLACIASLIMFGSILGVREGTVVAALLVGFVARIFNRRLAFIDSWLVNGTFHPKQETQIQTDTNSGIIITIAREYGSGGHEIGMKVAQKLNIPFYDREFIENIPMDEHISRDFAQKHEQNISNPLLYEMILQDFSVPIEKSLSADDRLFVAQSRMIRKLASQGPCVIVGRCADYVLRDFPNVLKVFIHADYEFKLKKACEEYGETEDSAIQKIKTTDNSRALHYKTYTGNDWRDASRYDLCLCSSEIGIPGCCEIIEAMAKSKYGIKANSL